MKIAGLRIQLNWWDEKEDGKGEGGQYCHENGWGVPQWEIQG